MLTAEQYAAERCIVDRAARYAEAVMTGPDGKRERNYLTADAAAHPDYVACDNAMRGRVEQYELRTNTPERFVAYIGARQAGSVYDLTTWTGHRIGMARVTSQWPVNSVFSDCMMQFEASVAGRTFTGRGMGEGMAVSLRETAASRKQRSAD